MTSGSKGFRRVRPGLIDRQSISAAIAGVDAVISAFGPAKNKQSGALMSEGFLVGCAGDPAVDRTTQVIGYVRRIHRVVVDVG